MAPNPKNPRQPRKPHGGGAPRRGRPRKEAQEEDAKRPSMPLPASLLDTTISDGEEYRPGTTAPAAEETRADAPELGNEQVPPPPAAPPAPQGQNNGGGQPSYGQPGPRPNTNYPNQGGGRHDRYFDRNRDRRHGGQPFHDNRPRQPLTPEEQAARDAQIAAQRAAAEAAAAERAKLARVLKLNELQLLTVPQLKELADSYQLVDLGALKKHELIFEILKANARCNGTMFVRGILEILPDNFGFLRSPNNNYLPCPDDIYVSPSQVRRFALRTGDIVDGEIRSPKDK